MKKFTFLIKFVLMFVCLTNVYSKTYECGPFAQIFKMAYNNGSIFVSNYHHVFRTGVNVSSWKEIEFPKEDRDYQINHFKFEDNKVYFSFFLGRILIIDSVNPYLANTYFKLEKGWCSDFSFEGKDKYILSSEVYKLTDNGQYLYTGPGLKDENTNCLVNLNDTLFVGASNGIYYSSDKGKYWYKYGKKSYDAYSMKKFNDYYFTMSNGDIYYDNNSWKDLFSFNNLFSKFNLKKLIDVYQHKNYFYVISDSGLYRIKNDLTTPELVIKDISQIHIDNLVSSGDSLYAGTRNGVYISADDGFTWKNKSSNLYVGDTYKIINSSDNFVSIKEKNAGWIYSLKSIDTIIPERGSDILNYNSSIYSFYYYYGSGYQAYSFFTFFNKNSIKSAQFRSQANCGANIKTFLCNDVYYITGLKTLYAFKLDDIVLKDTIMDIEPLTIAVPDSAPISIFTANNSIYWVSYTKGFLKSSDNGKSWVKLNCDLPSLELRAFLKKDAVLYAALKNDERIWKSEDLGDHWSIASSRNTPGVNFFSVYKNNIYACSDSLGVLMSDDAGKNFFKFDKSVLPYTCLEAVSTDNNLFVSTKETAIIRYVLPGKLNSPVLLSPANGSKDIIVSPDLTWQKAEDALSYAVQVSTNSTFSKPEFEFRTDNLQNPISGLKDYTKYYWRVKSEYGDLKSLWSEVNEFTTGNITKISLQPGEFVKISPNPTSDYIYIDYLLKDQTSVDLRITNTLGETVYSVYGLNAENKAKIDVTQLSQGVYWITLTSSNLQFTEKVTVTK